MLHIDAMPSTVVATEQKSKKEEAAF